ncbi:hypothetical protein [Aureibacter tunicatorum]|uniref:Uncharacterized protein n=1 Tax=Aureibacter tunicatorum TaxID=866807 RepID=A0AAE3XMP3_9BACT|nr:hypothetical protein [Aureibacter tunicatorum]MDR6239315.1 hypothetical protein [Aureibacter tunicatorum]BDD04761.1 hypothetical protein AUTU_22440 [Aureibacter tunicatorum]
MINVLFVASNVIAFVFTMFNADVIQNTDYDEFILMAIEDFTNSKIYKNGNIFSVSVYDDYDEDVIVIRIGEPSHKLLVTNKAIVGSYNSNLPTRIYRSDNKLIYWWNSRYPLTKEVFVHFSEYNLLQDDEDGFIPVPDKLVCNQCKAVHYYFCKTNVEIFKKVKTSKGVGYYKPPKINCFDQ